MTRASGAYRLVDRPSAHRKRGASRRVVARPSRRMPGWGAARMRRERRGWIAREASGRPARWRKYSAWKRRAWHSRPKSLSRRARTSPLLPPDQHLSRHHTTVTVTKQNQFCHTRAQHHDSEQIASDKKMDKAIPCSSEKKKLI